MIFYRSGFQAGLTRDPASKEAFLHVTLGRRHLSVNIAWINVPESDRVMKEGLR